MSLPMFQRTRRAALWRWLTTLLFFLLSFTAQSAWAADYSDAPSSYGDVSHTAAGIRLGTNRDEEASALNAGVGALGDDLSNFNDDDGVTLPAAFILNQATTIPVDIQSAAGYLNVWVDWNRNGNFSDAGEQIVIDQSVSVGTTNLSITAPTTASQGPTFARFRVCTTTNECKTPTTNATSGEVEDYRIVVKQTMPTYGGGGAPYCKAADTIDVIKNSDFATVLSTGDWSDWVETGTWASGAASYAMMYSDTTAASLQQTNLANLNKGSGSYGSARLELKMRFGHGTPLGLPIGFELEVGGVIYASAKTANGTSETSTPINYYNGATGDLSTMPIGVSGVETVWNVELPAGIAATTDVKMKVLMITPQFTNVDDVIIDYIKAYACASDHGDVASTYGDAAHERPLSTVLNIGSGDPDVEAASATPLDGTGDDVTGTDDENGVTLPTITKGQTVNFSVAVSGTGGYLQGWVDWNHDGDFLDSGEQVATNLQDNGTGDLSSTTGTITFAVSAPASAVATTTMTRFRWSTVNNLTPSAAATNGEVEDYPLTIGNITLTSSNNGTWNVGQVGYLSGSPAGSAKHTINITNTNALSNITITDTLPSGIYPALWGTTTYNGFSCSYNTPTGSSPYIVSCTQASLSSGTTSIVLPVWVDQLSVGSSTNQVQLTTTDGISLTTTDTVTVNPISEVTSTASCSALGGTLGANIFTNGDFGTLASNTIGSKTQSANMAGPITDASTTLSFYNGTNSMPDGQYRLANRVNSRITSPDYNWHWTTGDHTSLHSNGGKGNPNALMFVANASFTPSSFYQRTISVTPYTNYEFSNWAIHANTPDGYYFQYNSATPLPYKQAITVNRAGVDDDNDGSVDEVDEEEIIFLPSEVGASAIPTWHQSAAIFNSGAATSITFTLRNDGVGGAGNDLAIDDMLLAECDLPKGNITGVLYQDINDNNAYNAGTDTLLNAGIAISLKASDGHTLSTVYTDAAGAYTFTGVPMGSNYTLEVALADSSIPTTLMVSANPSGADFTGKKTNVTVTANATLLGQNFGFTIKTDYSDAPTTYGTISHTRLGIRLGTDRDGETTATTLGAGALGDDYSGRADEDGVTLPSAGLIVNQANTVPVAIQNASGYLNVWIDWNRDGDFLDSGEQVTTDQAVNVGTTNLSITPATTVSQGPTFARFRVCTTAGECNSPTTNAASGEVEDYRILVKQATPTYGTGGAAYCKAADTVNVVKNSDFTTVVSAGDWADWIEVNSWSSSDASYANMFSDNSNGSIQQTSLLNLNKGSGSYGSARLELKMRLSDGTPLGLPAGFELEVGGVIYASARTATGTGETSTPINYYNGATGNLSTMSVTTVSGTTDSVWSVELPAGIPANTDIKLKFIIISPTYNSVDDVRIDYIKAFACESDRGDAPSTYGEAAHERPLSALFNLGPSDPDVETTSATPLDGTGDNVTGTNDEAGVSVPNLTQAVSSTILVRVVGSGGYLQGWLDWNGDGDFADTNEQIMLDVQDNTAPDTDASSGTIAVALTPPSGLKVGNTFARFRFSNISGLSSTGSAANGEVEDYPVTILNTPPTFINGSAVSFTQPENQTAIATLPATDINTLSTLTYSIDSGADAALFNINTSTGTLSFKVAPDYDVPTDAGGNNVYEVVVKVTDSNGGNATQSVTVTITDVFDTGVMVSVKGLLQSVYNSTTKLMRDDLRVKGLIPSTQPYNVPAIAYTGTESVSPATLAITGNNAVVDWVLVELRSAADPLVILQTKALVIQRDGDVVEPSNAATDLKFFGLAPGNYYVTLRHRNHIGIMSAAPIALSTNTTLVDFTKSATATYGTDATLVAGTAALMWAGDTNYTNQAIANGPDNDLLQIVGAILTDVTNTNMLTNYRLAGYRLTDVNMDGETIFAGPNNDVNILVGSVLMHPANATFSANYVVKGGIPQAQQ